jgi:hypothetical protein
VYFYFRLGSVAREGKNLSQMSLAIVACSPVSRLDFNTSSCGMVEKISASEHSTYSLKPLYFSQVTSIN